MSENGVMERKKQIFQMDARLKELFNGYCSARGLIQEVVLEALVYMLVKKDLMGSADRDELLQEVSRWKGGAHTAIDDLAVSPGQAGAKVADALQRGAASRKRSRKGAG